MGAIKFFKIISSLHDDHSIDSAVDGNPYINFWGYALSNQTWHKVSLIPYLQQANIQINNNASTIATKKPVLPTHYNPLYHVATDALLEELLDVHTLVAHFNRLCRVYFKEIIKLGFSFQN